MARRKQPTPLPDVGNSISLSNVQVGTLLQDAFAPLMQEEFEYRRIISDTAYESVGIDFVRAAVLTDPVLSPASYRNDLFDCDDYVFFMKVKLSLYASSNKLTAPLALGCILTVKHALNFCIDKDQVVHVFNTQSDDRLSVSDPALFPEFLELSPRNPIQLIYV